MSNKSTSRERWVRVSAKDLKPPTPSALRRLVAGMNREPDTSDIPPITPQEFTRMAERHRRRLEAAGKERVTMFIDRDVLATFKAEGPGYQTRINDVLRAEAARRVEPDAPATMIRQAMKCLEAVESRLVAGRPRRRKTRRPRPAA